MKIFDIKKQKDLILPDELEDGRALQDKFEAIRRQGASVNPGNLQARYKTTQAAYESNPSDENFSELKKAIAEEIIFNSTDTRVRGIAVDVFNKFYKNNVVPWAKPIALRAVERAGQSLAEITAEENERHLSVVGTKAGRSDIIEAAKRPVQQCEEFLKQIEDGISHKQPREIAEFFGRSFQ